MNLIALDLPTAAVQEKQQEVRGLMLRESVRVREGNFRSLGEPDLLVLFRLYDRVFFGGELGAEVLRKTGMPVKLRLSTSMTRAGGKTTQFRRRTLLGKKTSYEIAIASRLLLCSFEAGGRAISVSGLPCGDRLDALQRIMEHEIIHLAEWLTFGETSCARTRFMNLARRIFGHRKRFHELITPREHVQQRYDVVVGDCVHFSVQGQTLSGIVNRIGVRATVLVQHSGGRRYSDGRCYVKYLVPPARLRKTPAGLELAAEMRR